MSRSYAKHPYFSYHKGRRNSEKEHKRLVNRRMRRISKQLVNNNWEDEDLVLPVIDEIGNLYNYPSDGGLFYAGHWKHNNWYSPIEFFLSFLRR